MKSHASFWEAVKSALQALRGNKLRSFLTLLGIILATTTLIAVISVISGMNVYIAQNVSSMGADGYRIQRIVMMGFDPKKYLEMLRRNPNLTKEEFEFLHEHLTMTREIGVVASRGVTVHRGTDFSEGVGLQGASPNVAVITNYEAEEGRFITEVENDRRVSVAFIGHDLKEKFFSGQNPVGRSITAEGVSFQIVGVAKAKGSVFGQSQDNFLVIPIETYFKIWGSRSGMTFVATSMDHEHLIRAQDEARMLLRAYRHLRPGEEDTFSMLTSDALLDFWNQLTGAIAATAVAVVAVFLVVGGVVIMNIMLAVVTERTHEIGIRKSVGARRGDILNQFLVESSVLSATGGLAGVTVAWVLAVLVRTFTPVPMSVPVLAVFAGVALSTVVGLFFGIYPAYRASKLDPIEALRAEK
jgi:putative ABC transport system permease protein